MSTVNMYNDHRLSNTRSLLIIMILDKVNNGVLLTYPVSLEVVRLCDRCK